MNIAKKALAIAAATALATGGLLVTTVSPAQAAPQITLSSPGPFKGGEKVTVTATGFSPSAPVAMGLIPASRYPAEGPGDACASKLGCSALLVADASGKVSKELVVIEGSIENSKAPVEKCGPNNACVFGAANINNPAETAKVDVKYVAAAPAPSASAPASSAAPSDETPAALPQTGPGETLAVGLLGLAIFQIGLVFAVRAFRKTPRGHMA